MLLQDLSQVQVPPGVAIWINRLLFLSLGLLVLWLVLEVLAFFMRRAYNLTPAESTSSKNLRPDFLKVDHKAREEMIERGKEFTAAPQSGGVAAAASTASLGAIGSGLLTFVSATFFAFGRVEELDKTWKDLSGWDRLTTIVQSHPVGFAFAGLLVVGAGFRLVKTIRRK
jgi:hypothetical protein